MSKVLSKSPKRWGIYSPNRKLAVRLIWQPDRLAVDRPGRPPTVRIMTVGAIRSTVRPTVRLQRAELSGPVDRSVGRPTVLPDVHSSVHVGRPQGRPALGAVDVRSTDLASQPALGQKSKGIKTKSFWLI